MLIDTHTHLQLSEYDTDRLEVIARARAIGVEKIIVVGIDAKTSQDALELAEGNSNIYAAVGLHPHEAKLLDAPMLSHFENLAKGSKSKVVAIGEIGLDYYRNLSSKEEQIKAFEAQIELAKSLSLPIIVHNRDSHHDIVNILKSHSSRLASLREIQGVMHCFSGSLEVAEECVKIGFYISIAGPVTFPNASKLQEIARSLPLERLLIETDSPWLSPQSKRGKRDEPAYVREVAEKIAQLRGTSFEELANATTDNAKRLFDLEMMKG